MAKSSLIGRIAFDLVANTGQLLAPLRVAQNAVKGFGASVKTHVTGALGSIRSAVSGASAQLLGLGGALSAGGLVAYAMKQAVAYEDASMAFKTFLGDAEKAKAFMADMKKFSDVTPFTADEVTQAGKKLLAFGFASGEVVDTMKYLGDAAASTGNRMEDLVVIIGQIRMKQKLMGEEVLQLHERGIPITNALAKVYGKTAAQITQMVSAGKIGFNDVTKAMQLMNTEGGLFFNSMDALSKTTSGKLSTLKSAFDGAMREIGTIIIDGLDIKGMTDKLTSLVTGHRDSMIAATQTTVNAIITGAEAAVQAVNWVASNTYNIALAWKAAQFGATLALTGLIDLSALALEATEWLIESVAAGYTWAFKRMQQGAIAAFGVVMKLAAEAITMLDSMLPTALQTGAGTMAQEIVDRYIVGANEALNKIQGGIFEPVDINMGSETAREFADNMLEQARIASEDFWQFVEKGPDLVNLGAAIAETVEAASSGAAKAMATPLGVPGAGGKSTPSVGALERGSVAAMSAIADTRKSLSIEQQNLDAQKRHTNLLNAIERNTRAKLAPAGL